jgi:hypothetical protein
MILSEQACVVLGEHGEELDWFDPWCDEADDLAKTHRGYVVQANSQPARLFADFRPSQVITGLVTPAESAALVRLLGRWSRRAFNAANVMPRHGPAWTALRELGRDLDDTALAVRDDQFRLGLRQAGELQHEMTARHNGGPGGDETP